MCERPKIMAEYWTQDVEYYDLDEQHEQYEQYEQGTPIDDVDITTDSMFYYVIQDKDIRIELLQYMRQGHNPL